MVRALAWRRLWVGRLSIRWSAAWALVIVAGALLPVAVFCLWLVFSSGDPQVLQQRSDLVSEQFQSLGLEMDPQVMDAMIRLDARAAVGGVSFAATELFAGLSHGVFVGAAL